MGMFIWGSILGIVLLVTIITYIRQQKKLRMRRKYEESRTQIEWLNQGISILDGAVKENRRAMQEKENRRSKTMIRDKASDIISNGMMFQDIPSDIIARTYDDTTLNTSDHHTSFGGGSFGGGGAGSDYSSDSSYDSGGSDSGGCDGGGGCD